MAGPVLRIPEMGARGMIIRNYRCYLFIQFPNISFDSSSRLLKNPGITVMDSVETSGIM